MSSTIGGLSGRIGRNSPEVVTGVSRKSGARIKKTRASRDRLPAATSVQQSLPAWGDPAGGARHGLLQRVVPRRDQLRTLEKLLGRVVPEPILAGLEALGDGMAGSGGVAACMLRGRRVAAADVAAAGAAAEVKPPAPRGEAFHASRAARRHRWIDGRVAQSGPSTKRWYTRNRNYLRGYSLHTHETSRALEGWPVLTLSSWQDTQDTLHLWTQIIGKVRLALEPMVNHWWQVPLYVSARGLTTSAMHADGLGLEIEFDFVAHVLAIRTSAGQVREIALEPRSVADFYAATMQ